MWRAIRFGLDGRLIDLERARGVPGARGGRAPARVDGARARGAWRSTRCSRSATARSASARMIDAGATRARRFRGLRRARPARATPRRCGLSRCEQTIDEGRAAGEPSEEELRAAYEAELRRLTRTDMIAQAAVSLLNIGARRLAPAAAERSPAGPSATSSRRATRSTRRSGAARDPRAPDPERADAAARRAVARCRWPTRSEVGAGAAARASSPAAGRAGRPAGAPSGGAGAAAGPASQGQRPPGPGPAESSGRLWVPGR